MASFESLESVQRSIELQKELLQTTDVSIKRITGRSPDAERRNNADAPSGTTRRFATNGPPPTVFSRIDTNSGIIRENKVPRFEKPDDEIKVSLPSSVVRVGEKRSRSDAIKEYKSSDKERYHPFTTITFDVSLISINLHLHMVLSPEFPTLFALLGFVVGVFTKNNWRSLSAYCFFVFPPRGRRMFGVLQATLTQFKAECTGGGNEDRKQQQRREIESRIDAKAAEEKAAARQERADLFRQRKQQQVELGLLQQKMRMMHEFEAWKEERLKMVGFIRTTHSPAIFYRPKVDNAESESRKDSSKAKILELIDERRRHLEAEYADMASARRRRLGITPPAAAADNDDAPSAASAPAMPSDASPERQVHITKKQPTAAPAPAPADFDDLEDEPVLMDEEEPDRRMAEGASVPAGGMPAQLLERLAAREAQRKAAEHMSRRERRTVGEGLGGTGVDIQLPPLRLEPLNDDEAPVFTSPLHNTPSFFLEHMARAKALLLGRINRFCEACSTAEDSPSPSERTKVSAAFLPCLSSPSTPSFNAPIVGDMWFGRAEMVTISPRCGINRAFTIDLSHDKLEVVVAQACLQKNHFFSPRQTLDDLLSQIEELQRWFSESSPHLKPFHVEQARLDVEEIKARFHEVRETVLPKKKFKFGNKTTTDATKPKHSPQQAVSPLKAPVAGVVAVAPSKFTFSNLVDRDDLRLPAPGDPADALRDQSICLSDLTRCVVHVESISGNLMMNRLTGCTVYTRQPVASSVLLRNCTDCRFVLACRQLRIHQTRDTRLDIFVPSAPIIEDSCRLTVGPYTSCPSTREVFGEAENHWNHVQDFSCPTLVAENATKSPNWSLLPESDWLRDNQ
ncbi:unnamed protein product [Mesocestoides corti]|uniref:C-CAP/cofactor C-like domain-containing protein n=1 Tax=Mesocestoides corti TaxID=53468 RepID=A0A0R3U4I0_MESCO|nr:unnamed protein product [Mesocestoides corti]